MLALEDIMDFHQLRQQGMSLRIPFPYQKDNNVNFLIVRYQQQKKIVLVRPCYIEIFPATQAIFPNG